MIINELAVIQSISTDSKDKTFFHSESEKLAVFNIESRIVESICFFLGINTDEYYTLLRQLTEVIASGQKREDGVRLVRSEKLKLVQEAIQKNVISGMNVVVSKSMKPSLIFFEGKYDFDPYDVSKEVDDILSKNIEPLYRREKPEKWIQIFDNIIEIHAVGFFIIFSKEEDYFSIKVRSNVDSKLTLDFLDVSVNFEPKSELLSNVTLSSRDFDKNVKVPVERFEDERLIFFPKIMSSSCEYYGNGRLASFTVILPEQDDNGNWVESREEIYKFRIDPLTNKIRTSEDNGYQRRLQTHISNGLSFKIEEGFFIVTMRTLFRDAQKDIQVEHRYPLHLDYTSFPLKIVEAIKSEFAGVTI